MSFRVNQRIICIDDTTPGCLAWKKDEALVKGRIYTVRRCFVWPNDGTLILWLNEVCRCKSAQMEWGRDIGYGAYRFRPIVERKTNIEIFQRLLVPTEKVPCL